MALTFAHCRSCGGKTQINLKVPAEDRRCMLCGQACDVQDEMELPEERTLSPEAEEAASGQSRAPVEMVKSTCPRCRNPIAIDPQIPVEKQRCHACGMLFKEPPKKGRMRKESQITPDGLLKGRNRERVWMPVLGTMLVVVFVAIFALWMKSRKEPTTAAQTGGDAPDAREQIGKLLTHFMAAKTPEELTPLIRKPETFGTAVTAWLDSHPGSLPLGGQVEKIGYPQGISGALVSNVVVSLPTRPQKLLLAVETPAGFRVDWRSFTEVGDMSVEEFVAQKPRTPTLLMVAVRKSDYYNHAYKDSSEWDCLRVTAEDGASAFFAYVPRGNKSLMAAFANLPPVPLKRSQKLNTTSRRMVLRLGFLQRGDSENPQAEVESVVSDGWYVP